MKVTMINEPKADTDWTRDFQNGWCLNCTKDARVKNRQGRYECGAVLSVPLCRKCFAVDTVEDKTRAHFHVGDVAQLTTMNLNETDPERRHRTYHWLANDIKKVALQQITTIVGTLNGEPIDVVVVGKNFPVQICKGGHDNATL